jgi:predicted RNA-binding protein (virulence factor B family)
MFSWLAGKVHSGRDLSVFDMKNLSKETLAQECYRFMEKGSFVELGFNNNAGVVIKNEAHTGNGEGGAQVSAD